MQQPPNQPPNQQPPNQQPPNQQPYTNYQQQPPQFAPQGQYGGFSGQPAPMPPPKKKSRLGLILGIIAGVCILGCIGTFVIMASAAKSISSGTVSTSNGSNSSSSSTGQIAKVGQTITISDVATTLVSVKTLAGDEFSKPKPGNEFIVVHIKMVNNGSSEQSYNPVDFHVKSGTGNITDETFTTAYTGNNQLQYGKLSPGGKVEGDIVFEAPKGDHKAELTWQPSIFGNSGDNGWYLGL